MSVRVSDGGKLCTPKPYSFSRSGHMFIYIVIPYAAAAITRMGNKILAAVKTPTHAPRTAPAEKNGQACRLEGHPL